MKHPPLKYEIRIGAKPRGNWRPRAKVVFEKVENPLNINPEFDFLLIHRRTCGDWEEEFYTRLSGVAFPLPFFCHSSRWDTVHPSACCSQNIILRSKFDCRQGYVQEFYLDWKPGPKPDYSDCAEALVRFCDAIVAEYEKRCQEAFSSGESEEIVIKGEGRVRKNEKNEKVKKEKKGEKGVKTKSRAKRGYCPKGVCLPLPPLPTKTIERKRIN